MNLFLTLLFGLTSFSVSAAEIKWYGHATLKITTDEGKVILVDPFITKNPKTPKADKDLTKLEKVDLILLTHGHGDHIGDTLEIVKSTKAKVAMNADMAKSFTNLKLLKPEGVIRFNKSGNITPLGNKITISMVRAEHSSSFDYINPKTKEKVIFEGGEPCGYVIKFESGKSIYISGDTGVFGDMKLIYDFYRPDVAILSMGDHFTMGSKEAAYAVNKLIPAKIVIPYHYGTFGLLKGDPMEMKKLVNKKSEVKILTPGETFKL